MGTITFNNVESSTVGIYVSTFPTYPYPSKNIETYSIPGRNGDIIFDDGTYSNVDQTYEVSLYYPSKSIESVFADVIAWLHPATLGYCQLYDSYYPDTYRLAICKNAGQVANLLNTVGTANIVFNCRPERFIRSTNTRSGNTIHISANTSTLIRNNYNNISAPMLTVHGSQTIKISTNSSFPSGDTCQIKVSGTNSDIIIDGENLEAKTSGGVVMNQYVEANSLPRFKPGNNYILSTGTLEVDPKWWKL